MIYISSIHVFYYLFMIVFQEKKKLLLNKYLNTKYINEIKKELKLPQKRKRASMDRHDHCIRKFLREPLLMLFV